MKAIQTFQMQGGPLDGCTVELVDEDTMHPDTIEIRVLGAGIYRRDDEARPKRRVLAWEAQTTSGQGADPEWVCACGHTERQHRGLPPRGCRLRGCRCGEYWGRQAGKATS